MLCVFLVSCTPRNQHSTSPKPLIIAEEMVYSEGWKVCGTISVNQGGSYRADEHYLWTPGHPVRQYTGQLTPSLLKELEEVAKNARTNLIDGVPTYRIFIDDYRNTQPEPIRKLFQTVLEQGRPDRSRGGAKEQVK